jgi:hypothetical protein
VLPRSAVTLAEDSMVYDTDKVSRTNYGVPTGTIATILERETVFTVLAATSRVPILSGFHGRSLGPFIKEVSALYEG